MEYMQRTTGWTILVATYDAGHSMVRQDMPHLSSMVMRCVVCRDVQCTNSKIMNFTPSTGCLLCNVTLHTEVRLQVQRDFCNLVYWENSVVMRCIVCRDVQCTNNKIMNFTSSAGCLLCNVMLHTEVRLQVWRGFHNLVYWENSAVESMLHTKCKIMKLETVGE